MFHADAALGTALFATPAGARGTRFWLASREGLVGILMGQGPSTRGHTRMRLGKPVYGELMR